VGGLSDDLFSKVRKNGDSFAVDVRIDNFKQKAQNFISNSG